MFTDTIFALATPPGKSAIAVIRISGISASAVPGRLGAKCPAAGAFCVQRIFNRNGGVIDQAVLLFMAGPYSSTGEDVVEIHCHGSRAVIQRLLQELSLMPGLRPAEPGEFTHRSFHYDKMDLSGAEGLADLIDAETDLQLTQAWNQLDGALRRPVMAWREALVSVAAQLEALIDFSDEDLPPQVEEALRQSTDRLITELEGHLDDDRIGEIIRDGVSIALVGPANAGKSTLLNQLAGRQAAIVSGEAGTTRDLVSVSLDIGGVPATVTDTAGIRETSGAVEAEGIRRAKEMAVTAQLTLLVVDGSDKHWREDYDRLLPLISGRHILVMNKADKGVIGEIPDAACTVSLLDGTGVDGLMAHLTAAVLPENTAGRTPLITRARHRTALRDAVDGLTRALTHNFHNAPELAAEDFRYAAAALGRITGAIDVEELLGSIFSSFCIGK